MLLRAQRGQLVKLQNAEHALLQENAQLRLRVDTSLGRGELAELMQRMAGKHRVRLRVPPVLRRLPNGPDFISLLDAARGKEVLGD